MILIVHKNELFALEIKSSEHYFIDVIQNIYVHEPKKSEIWLLTFPFSIVNMSKIVHIVCLYR